MPLTAETLTEKELEQLRAAALGQEVPVANIESEFKKLWDLDNTATRASLMNFAIYSERLYALTDNTRLIAEITLEHACRALLIMSLPAKRESRVRSWITAHCQLDQNGNKVACSEQVAFLLEGTSSALIRNIVFAHLDSDLPLVLWWQGELNERFEERLYSRVDRLIIDSTGWSDPRKGYDSIASTLQDDRSHFIVHDLAWTRSHQFRLALASCFDDATLLARLPEIHSVSIVAGEGQQTTALFLLAWIAATSGWLLTETNASAGTYSFSRSESARPVNASLEIVTGTAPLGLLQLRGDGLSVSVGRGSGAEFLHQQVEVEAQCHKQILPAASESLSGLVNAQLMRGGDNSLFFKTLPTFRDLLSQGLPAE